MPQPTAPYPSLGTGPGYPSLDSSVSSLEGNAAYPGLAEYMGMELSVDVIAANMPEYLPQNQVGDYLPTPTHPLLTSPEIVLVRSTRDCYRKRP